MKKFNALFIVVLIVAFAVPSFAGEYGKCEGTTQECLDKLAAKAAAMGYAGLDGEYNKETHTWVVTEVVGYSPASEAGFKVGDVIVGSMGTKFAEYDEVAWKAFEKGQIPGAEVAFMVKRDGHKKEMAVKLIDMPETAIAKFIGKHMVQHAELASADGE